LVKYNIREVVLDKIFQDRAIIIDLQYLPCLEYFICLLQAKKVILEAHEHYVKQSYRNRCYIRAANRIDPLTIPVKGGNKKNQVKDIQIDYQQKWLNNHWRAIQSAYGKAPFFEYFADYLESVFFKKHIFLFDFNLELLSACLRLLQTSVDIEITKEYHQGLNNDQVDLRSVVHPKKEPFENHIYRPLPYNQIFGNEFVGNLSVIDLIFNEGPNARNILTLSTVFN
jgi:hypothetical protein